MGLEEPQGSKQDGEISLYKETRHKLAENLKGTLTPVDYGDGNPFYKTENPVASQSIVDAVYSVSHQENKLSEASKDPHGRPVRYYREIGIGHLLNLLEAGEDQPLDYHTKDFMLDKGGAAAMARMILRERGINTKERQAYPLLEKLFHKVSKDEIYKIFGANGNETSWKEVLQFIEENLSNKELKKIHAVSRSGRENIIQFSPFLSVCPGGPRFNPPPNTSVIVEMVIPDDQVQVNEENKTKLEREALTRSIKEEYISRIILGKKAFNNIVVHNPQTPVGEYVLSQANTRKSVIELHTDWLINTPITDTMPVQE